MAEKTEKKRKRAGGAPSKYDPGMHPRMAASLAKRGATDREIADVMGVSASTLYRWQAEHPEFRESLKAAKAVADAVVEDSLYRRAVGCEVTDVRVTLNPDGSKVTVTTTRQLPGDVTACIFWLKNRQPKLWRDHPEADGQAATGEAIKAAIAACGLR